MVAHKFTFEPVKIGFFILSINLSVLYSILYNFIHENRSKKERGTFTPAWRENVGYVSKVFPDFSIDYVLELKGM